jgi:hypothetical protein
MHGADGIDVTVYFSLGKAFPAKMNHDMTIGSNHHLLFLCYNVLLHRHDTDDQFKGYVCCFTE